MAVAAGPASVSAVVAELVLAAGFSVGCKVSESAVVAELASAAGFGVGCKASGTNEYWRGLAGISVGYVDGVALSERTAFFQLTRWVIVFALRRSVFKHTLALQ